MSKISYRHESPIGRIPISKVTPVVDGGRWPAKAFQGEVIPFSAVVFREGHDALGVEVLLTSPTGKSSTLRMHPGAPGSDSWHVRALLSEIGEYKFSVRAFGDDYETWHHNAQVKLEVGVDEELMMLEGVALFARAAAEKTRSKENAKQLVAIAELLGDASKSAQDRFASIDSVDLKKVLFDEPIRSIVTLSDEYVIKCEREYAGAAAWYEFFPRSEG
ncbi:MAG: hypothetical protein RLZZ471_984, partial [Actinomycetota bacterium]